MKAVIGEAESLQGEIEVPGGNITAATAWMIAAVTARSDSNLTLIGVQNDPARNGIFEALQRMGARLEVTKKREVDGKPVADVWARASWLRGARIDKDIAMKMVDEIPLLAIAAAVAEGTTIVFYPKEERESGKYGANFFPSLAKMLEVMQVYSEQADQGILIEGEEHYHGGDYDTGGDGRMALALGIGGLIAAETMIIDNPECADDYYPGFWDEFKRITNGQVKFW